MNDGLMSEDAFAGEAMERVLAFELEARAAVAQCEAAGAKVLEAARQQARGIIEHAQARTVALHGRAAKKLEQCAAQLLDERMKASAEAVKQLSDPQRMRRVLERVAVRLTTDAGRADVP
jgi:vacuolar-type H+-ATPase subunit H